MRVLVTGVTGRIGRNLATHLLERSYTVRGLAVDGDPGLGRAVGQGVECITGDIRDEHACREAAEGCDAIVHLGALLKFGPDDNRELFEVNFGGLFNILEAARATGGLQRFVFASSDEVYPALLAKYLPIDETHPTEPYGFYGVTKLAGEDLVTLYGRAYGVPVSIARFALTVEPWEALTPEGALGRFFYASSMAPIVRNRAGAEAERELLRRQNGDENALILPRDEAGVPYRLHFCDVRDLVRGIELLLTHPAAVGETFNLSGPAPISCEDAVHYIAERTGQRIVDIRIPGPTIRFAHSILKARSLLGYMPNCDLYATLDTALVQRTD
jgi:UDP-glucose 4-epimerase